MKIRKHLAIMLATMLAVASFTACGGGTDKPSSAESSTPASTASSTASASASTEPVGESVKLNVWVAGSGDASANEAYTTILDRFCANNPGVSYELTFIAWGDYFTKLNTGLVGGAGPDVFMTGYGQVGTIYDSGDLLDLTPYIPEGWDGTDDFLPNILNMGEKDGKYFAFFSPSTRCYFYRKDIAEQNGVTEEELHIKTQEDFYNLVRKMTVRDASGNVEIYGLEVDPDGEQDFFVQTGMLASTPSLWDDEYIPNFNTPDGARAMSDMYQLYQEGVVCLRDAGANAIGVQTGVAAISLTADSGYVTADAAFPGQIGVLKNDMTTLLIGNYMACNAATKYPEQAAAMLLDMFSAESSKVFAEVMGQYSGRASLDEHYLSLNPDYENIIHSYGRSISFGRVFNPKYNQGVSFLRPALESIYHGTPAQEALDGAQAEWAALYS